MIQRHVAETMDLTGFDFFNDAKDTALWLRGLKSTKFDRLANELEAGRERQFREMTKQSLKPDDPVTIKNTNELVTKFDHKPGVILKQWKTQPEFYTVLVDGYSCVFHESQIHMRKGIMDHRFLPMYKCEQCEQVFAKDAKDHEMNQAQAADLLDRSIKEPDPTNAHLFSIVEVHKCSDKKLGVGRLVGLMDSPDLY